jgi:hypothetical protein
VNRHFRGAKVTTSKNKTVAALRRDAHGGLHQSLSRVKRLRASVGCWLIGQTRRSRPSTDLGRWPNIGGCDNFWWRPAPAVAAGPMLRPSWSKASQRTSDRCDLRFAGVILSI